MHLAQTLMVHDALDLMVIEGANIGDPLGDLGQLVPSDVYRLRRGAAPSRLLITCGAGGRTVVAQNCPSGLCGHVMRVVGDITLMSAQGRAPCPAIVLATESPGNAPRQWLMSFGTLHHDTPYALIHANPGPSKSLIRQLGSASFVAGTMVMMDRGGQRPIESLRAGDLVMTRSHGPQPIRATDQQTLRAEGMFAPIVLRKGVLNVTQDLWLSPQHRLFVYQRQDQLGFGRKELTIQAEMLVNGVDIVQKPGGFQEYHELVFDRPEIIFVNGIAAESRFTSILGMDDGAPARTPAPSAVHLHAGDLANPLDHHRIRAATQGHVVPGPRLT